MRSDGYLVNINYSVSLGHEFWALPEDITELIYCPHNILYFLTMDLSQLIANQRLKAPMPRI